MAIASLKYKSLSSTLTAPAEIDLGGMIPIATVTVGSGGAANVQFTSIAGTYAHLQVRLIARTNRAASNDGISVTINSDTGNNYAYHYLYGDGSSAAAGASATRGDILIHRATGNSTDSTNMGAIYFDILDYANTNKYKTLRSLGGFDNNGSGEIYLVSGLWQNTSAITAIKLAPTNGTGFTQYSHFALYGIKAV